MSPIKLEKMESAIRVTLKFVEAFNSRDPEGLLALLVHDTRWEPWDLSGELLLGKKPIGEYLKELWKASHLMEIEEIQGYGHRCLLRWKLTRAGSKDILQRGVDLIREKDGFILEILSYGKLTHRP